VQGVSQDGAVAPGSSSSSPRPGLARRSEAGLRRGSS